MIIIIIITVMIIIIDNDKNNIQVKFEKKMEVLKCVFFSILDVILQNHCTVI